MVFLPSFTIHLLNRKCLAAGSWGAVVSKQSPAQLLQGPQLLLLDAVRSEP